MPYIALRPQDDKTYDNNLMGHMRELNALQAAAEKEFLELEAQVRQFQNEVDYNERRENRQTNVNEKKISRMVNYESEINSRRTLKDVYAQDVSR